MAKTPAFSTVNKHFVLDFRAVTVAVDSGWPPTSRSVSGRPLSFKKDAGSMLVAHWTTDERGVAESLPQAEEVTAMWPSLVGGLIAVAGLLTGIWSLSGFCASFDRLLMLLTEESCSAVADWIGEVVALDLADKSLDWVSCPVIWGGLRPDFWSANEKKFFRYKLSYGNKKQLEDHFFLCFFTIFLIKKVKEITSGFRTNL